MKEINASLMAGEEVAFVIVGKYFRLMQAEGDINVSINDLNINTNFKVGVGIKLGQFSEIRIKSDISQKIVFVVSNEQVDDQRVITVEKAGASYSDPAAVDLIAGVAKEVLPIDTARFLASIQPDADMYIGADGTVTTANGIKIAAGSIVEIKNKGALWCVSASETSVRLVSEYE